jgi:hypothetical protein
VFSSSSSMSAVSTTDVRLFVNTALVDWSATFDGATRTCGWTGSGVFSRIFTGGFWVAARLRSMASAWVVALDYATHILSHPLMYA